MRTTFLTRAAALTAVAFLQWIPTTAHAAEPIPAECLTTPAPAGPVGDQGLPGAPGQQGPPGSPPNGPARQPHTMEPTLPLCDDIEGICIIKQVGPKGPIGETGDPGLIGPPGSYGPIGETGPARAPHSLAGVDPCEGIAAVCEITIVGPQGPQGPKGETGPVGPAGDPYDEEVGPARITHAQYGVPYVEVAIPASCIAYLESLVPTPSGLPETGGSSGTLAAFAAALVALGSIALVARRRAAA